MKKSGYFLEIVHCGNQPNDSQTDKLKVFKIKEDDIIHKKRNAIIC